MRYLPLTPSARHERLGCEHRKDYRSEGIPEQVAPVIFLHLAKLASFDQVDQFVPFGVR